MLRIGKLACPDCGRLYHSYDAAIRCCLEKRKKEDAENLEESRKETK